MKKVLIIIALLAAAEARAVKLCKKCTWSDYIAAVPTKWKTNDGLTGTHGYDTGYSDVAWNFTSTTSSATGTISGVARCSENNSINPPTASSAGWYCWCRVTKADSSSTCSASGGGPWVLNFESSSASGCQNNCARICAGACVGNGSYYSCSRSALFAGATNTSSVTCPISGTCTDSNYKTVGDSDSCGSEWAETTNPTLALSGTNTGGTYTATCAK